MKKNRIPLFLISFSVIAATLTGCSAHQGDDAALTLRTYVVPPGEARTLTFTLNSVLNVDVAHHAVGKASVSGSRHILVLAPKDLQPSIAASIAQIIRRGGQRALAQPVRLNIWVVNAYPGSGPLDSRLRTIAAALKTFAQDSEPAHFTQQHYFTAVTDMGATGTIAPLSNYFFHYTLTGSRNGITVSFYYRNNPAGHQFSGGQVDMRGRVTIAPGQTVVLGTAAEQSTTSRGHEASNSVQSAKPQYRLLVVRVTPTLLR